ncbi:MAG: hypothetical protein FJY29_02255 [Betaproteobacteria bacterium]|nr:hypothetical protein [Betaproteobacteria bacterium]
MPQALDSLPPPAVEWRRESDDERRERLEKSGVLNPQVKPAQGSGTPAAPGASSSWWTPDKFVADAQEQKKTSQKFYTLWCGVDLARWNPVKSPRDTRNVADGSFGLNFELTHPQWRVLNAQFGFGPKAVFYHGGQYAKLNEPPFSGSGYARFSSGELGIQASLTQRADETQSDWVGLWSWSFYYLPVRFIEAESTSSVSMIPRSDTYSRTALSLPGIGLQTALGFDWNSLLKVDMFAGIQGAWPWQLRSRVGLQFSMALSHAAHSASAGMPTP